MSASMRTGVPAASASSCAWQVRSIVTNHHTASSTEWPTVSRPWLRRMTALRLPERVRDALALVGVEHDAGVVVEQRVVVVERARVLRERVEEPAERRPRLAVHRVRVRGGDDVGAGRVHAPSGWRTPRCSPRRRPRRPRPGRSRRMRSETRMWLKLMPNGFTQKWSSRSGSRAVMWPATPSSKPNLPKSRKPAARRCLRCRRSSSTVSNFGR